MSLTPLSVQKTRGDPWEGRDPRAFFRGRDSNRERLDLVRLHRNETELFDVALTNWFFFTKEYSEEVYGPKAKNVGFHDFFKVSTGLVGTCTSTTFIPSFKKAKIII